MEKGDETVLDSINWIVIPKLFESTAVEANKQDWKIEQVNG